MIIQLMVDRARNARTAITATIATIAIVVAALISVTVHGFVFGINNNIFHIPLALKWADDPIFANDQFIQSLRHFTSLVWVGVQRIATNDNIEVVFYLLHLLTRAASLLALALAARQLGICGLVPTTFMAFWFGIVRGLRWETPVGAGEIFTVFFSHSAVAIPVAIVAIVLGARRSYFWAFATLGVIANINAFIAMWVGWALVGVLAGDRHDFTKAVILSLAGLALAAVASLPVALWIYATIDSQTVSGLERTQFLLHYHASHSLIDGTPTERIVLFGAVAVSGLIGFRLIGLAAKAWFDALLALCVLVITGMLLPEIVRSRFLLDLHLIRASALVQLLGILGLSVAAMLRLNSPSPTRSVGGALAMCLLALPALQGILLAAAVMLSAERKEWKRRDAASAVLVVVAMMTAELWDTKALLSVGGAIAAAFIVLRGYIASRSGPEPKVLGTAIVAALACVAVYTYEVHRSMQSAADWEDARDAAHWARSSTPRDASFLVPQAPLSDTTSLFESLARRRIWVEWKRGGAAMWAPAYYSEWSKRMAEVAPLAHLASKLSYACTNDIDYVLIGPETKLEGLPRTLAPVYSNEHFRIFAARSWCAS